VKLRDHSTKAYRSYSEIEKHGRQHAVRCAVKTAGFPTEEVDSLTDEIIRLARWYRGDVDARNQRPRPKEVAASLRAVLSRGEAFREALAYLSELTRRGIIDADSMRYSEQAEADSYRLRRDVEHFLSSARWVLHLTPLDKGARRTESAHVNFAFRLSVLWRTHFRRSGITKRGVTGEYVGPLLDFAAAILQLEGAAYRNGPAFRSQLALAKSLHKHRNRAAEVAAKPLASMAAKASNER